ncbi:MAG: Xaa-Pro peptidase family protein [Eubacteriales bacterium]|nr:Xaa-Pro peptidase family protein [Eubacteriales bacterium]
MNNAEKLRGLLAPKDLQAVLITTPEHCYYATGLSPHQLTVSRIPGFAYAVMDMETEDSYVITMDYEAPALEGKKDHVKVLAYDTWVGVKSKDEWLEGKDHTQLEKLKSSLDILEELFHEHNWTTARVGLELKHLPVDHFQILKDRFPDIAWQDISDDFIFARSVKNAEEINIYRELTEASDKALLEMSKQVHVGANELDLIQIYRTVCMQNGVYPSSWSMLGAGQNSSILQLPQDHCINEGDCLRFDGGCEAGYRFFKTDFSRTWIVGKADSKLVETKRVLTSAQRLMIESIKPGMSFSELFHLGFNQVKKYIPNYRRGHLGHSISLGPSTADLPHISPSENRPIAEGMILAVEVPFYIRNYQGFNIEDMVLITKDGAEVLTYRTPHYLEFEE